MPEPTNPIAATIASVPALQANSQSAAWVLGAAPIASATSVEVGFTAYGCDSDPTQTARISVGSIWARFIALRAASMDMVITSSSSPGTAFSLMGSPPLPSVQTRATSLAGRRKRGTYAPYPTMPTGLDGFSKVGEGGGGVVIRKLLYTIHWVEG